MSDALSAVQALYFTMQANLNVMLAACPTQVERDQVMTQYVAARQNYWACINKSFHDDDPALQALVDQANDVNTTLTNINDELGDITKVINDLTRAVTIGTNIATKIIAL